MYLKDFQQLSKLSRVQVESFRTYEAGCFEHLHVLCVVVVRVVRTTVML